MSESKVENVGECGRCRHAWKALPRDAPGVWEKCPACGSANVNVRCGADAKTHEGTCRNFVGVQGGRCGFHGGESLRGLESPSYKDGTFSKFAPAMPEGFRSTLIAMLRDPEYSGLREHLALVDTLIYDALGRLDKETNESGKAWTEARTAYAEFKLANAAKDATGAFSALERLDVILNKRANDEQARREVVHLIEQRRKVADTEGKMAIARRYFLTIEQAEVLALQWADMAHDMIRATIAGAVAAGASADELRPKAEAALAEFVDRLRAMGSTMAAPVRLEDPPN